jgi:hypothetical protein
MIYNILSQSNASPWLLWLIIIILVIVLLVIIWWWFGRSKKESDEPFLEEADSSHQNIPTPADDLEIIEGIGPKIAALLKASGISTFKQLAVTDVDKLKNILNEANLRIADPTSWPEQAQLAAAGKMNELKVLQDTLKGGRRV